MQNLSTSGRDDQYKPWYPCAMSNMWGFDLDMTAVRLLRRKGSDWQEIAAEKIEGADIEERLMALVDRIDTGAAVHLFLPRDQILYTDVAIQTGEIERSDIERAMDGATPYPLEDLDLDWDVSTPGTARVAAIALETLDEAVAFAEVRGLKVAGFSSLADPADFPRHPAFTSHNILSVDATDDVIAEQDTSDPEIVENAQVEFASARVLTKPRSDAGSLAPVAPEWMTSKSNAAEAAKARAVGPEAAIIEPAPPEAEPVVQVDKAAPVMRLETPIMAPLDPGRPISIPTQTPRVRTDIASAVVSEQMASLTPPSVQVRRNGPGFWRIGAVFAVALLMTVGIAMLVWQLLPLGPGNIERPLTEDSGAEAETPVLVQPEIEIAVPELAPEATPEVAVEADPVVELEPEPEIADVPAVPDLPQPVFTETVANISAPDAETPPVFAAIRPVVDGQAPGFAMALKSGEGLPFIDLGVPLEPTPAAFASILTAAPAVDPDLISFARSEAIGGIEFAAINGSLSLDAVTLPAANGFLIDSLPVIEDAPAPFPVAEVAEVAEVEATAPATELASLDPAIVPEPQAAPEQDQTRAPTNDGATPVEPPLVTQTATLPTPTAFAAALPNLPPRARPTAVVVEVERVRFGGRTRDELAIVRPSRRPASAQDVALASLETAVPTDPLVKSSPVPRTRPRDFDAIVAVTIIQRQAEQVTASLDYQVPDTNAAIQAALTPEAAPQPAPQPAPRAEPQPTIPSSANVARQATIENAIRLNKVNLIGVYGTSANRSALVRLPSGRFVKVKVGDRVDGGTVAQITDDQLLYEKGRRTLALELPQG